MPDLTCPFVMQLMNRRLKSASVEQNAQEHPANGLKGSSRVRPCFARLTKPPSQRHEANRLRDPKRRPSA